LGGKQRELEEGTKKKERPQQTGRKRFKGYINCRRKERKTKRLH